MQDPTQSTTIATHQELSAKASETTALQTNNPPSTVRIKMHSALVVKIEGQQVFCDRRAVEVARKNVLTIDKFHRNVSAWQHTNPELIQLAGNQRAILVISRGNF